MYFSKDADSVPTFESPWIHRGWTPAVPQCLKSIEQIVLLLGSQRSYSQHKFWVGQKLCSDSPNTPE